MKYTLFACLIVLLFCQCADKTSSPNDSKPTKVQLRVSPATATAYQNLEVKKKALRPIARLCEESKGYRMDEWDALNECSWAVEKHQIGLYSEIVSRTGGQLFFDIADSTHVLTHKADEYYQFVDFLPESNHIVIRTLRPLACPEYWLINKKSGEIKTLPGMPVFATNKQSFLLSTSTGNTKIQCPKSISYWSLQDGDFHQAGSLENKSDIQDLMWYNGNVWLGKQKGKIVQIEV